MRGEQLVELYSRHVGDRPVSLAPMELCAPRDSTVILTKAAGMLLLDRLPGPVSDLYLNRLRPRRNRVAVDPVDGRLPGFAEEMRTSPLPLRSLASKPFARITRRCMRGSYFITLTRESRR